MLPGRVKSCLRVMPVGLILWLSAVSPARAGMCALCREALSSGGSPGLVRGLYWSILLIASMPLFIAAVVGIACFRLRRSPSRLRKPS